MEENIPLSNSHQKMCEKLQVMQTEEKWKDSRSFLDEVRQTSRNIQRQVILSESFSKKDSKIISEYLRLVKRSVEGIQNYEGRKQTEFPEFVGSLKQKYVDSVGRLLEARTTESSDESVARDSIRQSVEQDVEEIRRMIESLDLKQYELEMDSEFVEIIRESEDSILSG